MAKFCLAALRAAVKVRGPVTVLTVIVTYRLDRSICVVHVERLSNHNPTLPHHHLVIQDSRLSLTRWPSAHWVEWTKQRWSDARDRVRSE